MTGTLEQYLKGEPLTDELARLQKGEEPSDLDTDSGGSPFAPPPFPVARAIDDDDREHLRRLMLEPGWNVMLRLLDNDMVHQENLAKALSTNDPLGNREAVANAWAYIAMLRRGRDRMIMLIDEQIQRLAV